MDFSDVKVSTQTFIVHSNIVDVDLPVLFDNLTVQPDAPFPRLVNLSFREKSRGVDVRRKRPTRLKHETQNFLNCVSCSIQLHRDKRVNAKIFNNGTLQLTGCRCFDHARRAVIAMWRELETVRRAFDLGPPFVSMDAYVVSAMRNVDFKIGFEIGLERQRSHISDNTDYKITPIVQRFAGVKLSIPIESVANLPVRKLSFAAAGVVESELSYADFLEIKPSEKIKALKRKSVTIAVFQSGKVLISGVDETYQRRAYEWFVGEMESVRDVVGMKKSPPKTFVEYLPLDRRGNAHF